MEKGIIAVISGFSGAGKGTLISLLVERHEGYALSVSATTRAPRPGEEEGKSYFFMTDPAFEKLIQEGGFIEHAGYCGHYYGTPRRFVEDMLGKGINVLLEIEVQGALQIKEKYPDAVLLFVLPPSAGELKRRLEGRGTEDEEVISGRLKRAVEEAGFIERYDYILINDDLDSCVEKMDNIIRSSRSLVRCNTEFISRMRGELENMFNE